MGEGENELGGEISVPVLVGKSWVETEVILSSTNWEFCRNEFFYFF